MPSIRENTGRGGGYESGPGCGPIGIIILVALLIIIFALKSKGFISL